MTPEISLVTSIMANPDQIGLTGVLVVGLFFLFRYMLQKQPNDALARKMHEEAAALAIDNYNKTRTLLQEDLDQQGKILRQANEENLKALELRIAHLEKTNSALRDEIAILKVRNNELEAINTSLERRYQELLERIPATTRG